jgi:FkbM family methyltransferase
VEYNVLIQGWCNEGNINNGNIFDVFLSEEYRFLNVFEMDVIDVGASIGDSPIYFALRGAKRVIALEPFPYSYSFAELNVKKNNLTNKIEILNAGYGEDGFVIIDPDKKSFDYTELSNSDKGMKIPLYSLKTLIAQYQVHEAVLKMDCEGCEYNILKENNEILRKFKQIQIEYHYGYVELKNKLMNAGFDVRYTQPHKFYDRRKEINPNMELGYVYAVRMD